ncbi:hypothetical protein CRG98_040590 [Punica granatum]|uniref:Uncharacterized protein n=1 Tax=Punica granatum TaxID=22663 RepID=A0A2I0I4W2_PUNGR|nr:hypothetical protein CRG98_040590 [Punica granatum]
MDVRVHVRASWAHGSMCPGVYRRGRGFKSTVGLAGRPDDERWCGRAGRERACMCMHARWERPRCMGSRARGRAVMGAGTRDDER